MQQKLRQIPYYGTLLLLIYMPFHVFLVQSLSLATGGLDIWKAAKDVLTALLAAIIVGAVWHQKKDTKLFDWLVVIAAIYGLLHVLIWQFNPEIYRNGALLGTVYNNRLLWYLIIGMGTVLLMPKEIKSSKLIRLTVIISTIVCALGILQYFLPKDILTHLGYSLARGVKPVFFIDDKTNLPRIMSTLRDPNSLGAYLILPITLISYYIFIMRDRRRMLLGGLLALHLLALFLTFSRSAWLAVFVSVFILLSWQARETIKKILLKYWPVLLGVVLLGGSLLISARHQYAVQNILVHSDKSTKQVDSNGLHWQYVKQGIKGIEKKPLGHGPGTAGLVSIQNPKGGFLTENYYVQIGYEIGILGLFVFLAVNAIAYLKLSKKATPLAYCLLASFWGYVVMNMFLHTWSNEAVAAQWWILAGVAMAIYIFKRRE